MAKQEITQKNSDGDLLIWWHSDKYLVEDEAPEAGEQDCATCERIVDLAGRYWNCTDNGEVIHEGCDLPAW